MLVWHHNDPKTNITDAKQIKWKEDDYRFYKLFCCCVHYYIAKTQNQTMFIQPT